MEHDFSMNKLELRQAILTLLEDKLAVALSSAQRAAESATDEETIPEHKYDTLALEASYLAHGQAMRVQECEQEIRMIRELQLVDKPAKVGLGSLVVLANEVDEHTWFFIAPCAGGLKVEFSQQSVMLLTFDSPLGSAMRNKACGDDVEYRVADKHYWYEIEAIH